MDIRDRLYVVERGGGLVTRIGDLYRLQRPVTERAWYADAEMSDHHAWRPPLTLTVRARFSHPIHELRGTAGFGFWNAAVSPGLRRIRLPQSVWFFGAGPPHDVPLALGVPGRGFKAAVLDTRRLGFLALAPTAPIGFLMMRVESLYRRLWPIAQRSMGVSEVDLAPLDITQTHDYTFRWEASRVLFSVDSSAVLETTAAPRGPLEFVAWIDNAYAIATPRGRFEFGLTATPDSQWIDLERIDVFS